MINVYATGNIQTAVQLKSAYADKQPYGLFFDRKTMRHFGDTMKNFGVRLVDEVIRGKSMPVYELYRKKPVKHGRTKSSFFDPQTFACCFPDNSI